MENAAQRGPVRFPQAAECLAYDILSTATSLAYWAGPRLLRRIMSKEDSIEVTGTVVEKFPSGLFSVQLDQERVVLAHLAGKLRRNRIRVLAGDRVTLEMSPYDLTKGRITYRHK
jgi:translation initiation factor IF-1